ncbi:hypothetical protein [Nocardia exalbida]|uniref:hypothetical protein n=1 Tax=Nocardia exalbida TaxID=290231 RepID=UPI0012F6E558|nr:hypothetical protein [Nocardia exalbida]
MTSRKHARAAAAAAIALAMTTGAAATALADPVTEPVTEPVAAVQGAEALRTQILPGIEYSSNLADGSVAISTPLGSLTTQGGRFDVRDAQGNTVVGDQFSEETLAAQAPTEVPEQVTTVSVAGDVAEAPDSQETFNRALGVVATQFGLASGVGGMAGGIIGGTGGCLLGAVTGGTLLFPVSMGTLTLPAAMAGCMAGAGFGIAVGSVVGAAVVGIPVGIAALAQMNQTLNAPRPAAPPAPSAATAS